MPAPHHLNRLFYFTIEDESILAEAFSGIDKENYAIAYKVTGTEDVFVTTGETREAMDLHDVPYTILAEENSNNIAVLHTAVSQEELGDHEVAVKALGLASRAIAMACVGVNGDGDLGFDLSQGAKQYTYFTAPAGHTFIWRLFHDRDEAELFLGKFMADKRATDWAKSIPLATSAELTDYH